VQRLDGSYSRTVENENVLEAIEVLKPVVAFTFSTDDVSFFTARNAVSHDRIDFSDDFSIAVVDSVQDIFKSGFHIEKGINHCLCRQENFVFVWSSCASQLFEEANTLQKYLKRSVSDTLDNKQPSRVPQR